ncbi:sugar transferase [Paeniglutamicibacter gangotriensis]|uniref:Sugar transferase n=1 Tax=Paeniglutamicibacter gangotriensis TaxID=254787 RepID=A0A5B0EF74_9MICC|nr:sugar transferase [Paeniglutamicibacter gangotriensis]KAA0977543.1 sugar transferase [Paeniglutamicibacter gangotriensis]
MSQISGRLGGNNIAALQTWKTAFPATSATAGITTAFGGRSYRRRVLMTDVVLICLASVLPAVLAMMAHQDAAGNVSRVASGIGLTNMEDSETPRFAIAGMLVAFCWILSLIFFRTRAIGRIAVGMQEYKFLAYATAALAGLIGALALITTATDLRIFLVVSLPIGLGTLLLGRWGWRHWLGIQRDRGFALSNVLIYGQAKDAPYVVRQISRKSGPAYRVVGVLLDGDPDNEAESKIRAADPTLPLSYDSGRIEDEIRRLGADSVVVAGPLVGGNRALQELGWRLETCSAQMIVVSALTNVADRRMRMSPVDGMPMLHVDLPRFTGWRFVAKRAMDIVFSAIALLCLLPVFAVVAMVIRLDSPGKVFFKQDRAGRDGTPFKMYKFRTMVDDAEAQLATLELSNEGAGPLFKLKNDPRITRVGGWLRRHSIDEIPQFLNVLRGEMSVVGPRPPLYKEVADYTGHDHRRLYIKPGVTGLWQVSGRSNLDWEESVRLDLYYVENWTVLSDIRIVWRTFKVMIKPDGAF